MSYLAPFFPSVGLFNVSTSPRFLTVGPPVKSLKWLVKKTKKRKKKKKPSIMEDFNLAAKDGRQVKKGDHEYGRFASIHLLRVLSHPTAKKFGRVCELV